MRLIKFAIIAVMAHLVGEGCSHSCCNVSADAPSIDYNITERVSLDFPATYSGTLPCADCDGIRYTINIWSDQVFFRRTQYLGEGEGISFDDIGHWSFSTDGSAIILSSQDETPELFAIEGRDMLRPLDMEGRPIESEPGYTLTRQAKIDWFEPHVRLHGMYTCMADAGVFTECLSRLCIPVASEADNASLLSSYSFARNKSGGALLVSVEGRIVNRTKPDGQGKEQVLVVEKFLNLWPGEGCSPEAEVAAGSGER